MTRFPRRSVLRSARLIQFTIAGVDFIPLGELPEGVPVATNGGGHAEIVEHENLKRGQFNQFARNRMLAGAVCGIFGLGGIGAATGRLMSSIGMRVYAINRRGRTNAALAGVNRTTAVHICVGYAAIIHRAALGLFVFAGTCGLFGASGFDRNRAVRP